MRNLITAFVVASSFFSPLARGHFEDLTTTLTKKYDFSGPLTPKTKFLGYIDPKYKRLKIEFSSITKSSANPKVYLVKGQSTVGKNTCPFSGTIRVQRVNQLTKMHYGVDDEYKDKGILSEGTVEAKYTFTEEGNQKICGVFEGDLTLNWYVDKDQKLRPDDMEASYSDSFCNNQYQGTWSAKGSSKKKVASWGEFRIPNSGDLDIGAGEFSPNPKYIKQGWDDLIH